MKSKQIRGWNILSAYLENELEEIAAAEKYNINHLQLSHQLIMDLKDVRQAEKLSKTRALMNAAHDAGIEKLFVWDHALYNLDYYPEEYLTEERTIKS